MQTAFRIENGNATSYYDLFIPQGSSTSYWLASRCIDTYLINCSFNIRYVNSGSVESFGMYDSNDNTSSGYRGLFPVISLNASLITGNTTTGFTVNLN